MKNQGKIQGSQVTPEETLEKPQQDAERGVVHELVESGGDETRADLAAMTIKPTEPAEDGAPTEPEPVPEGEGPI